MGKNSSATEIGKRLLDMSRNAEFAGVAEENKIKVDVYKDSFLKYTEK
jgi:hypothetical protein